MKDLRESICALCGCDIVEVMQDYSIYINEKQLPVCGKCYVLTQILDTLKGIKDGNNRRPRLQVPDGDVH